MNSMKEMWDEIKIENQKTLSSIKKIKTQLQNETQEK